MKAAAASVTFLPPGQLMLPTEVDVLGLAGRAARDAEPPAHQWFDVCPHDPRDSFGLEHLLHTSWMD